MFLYRNINLIVKSKTAPEHFFLRIGMANSVAKIDKINDDYSGMTDDDGNVIPEFIIVTPGEHTVTDNTRYDITTLPKDESGYYKGIEITVYEIDPETSERVETTSEEVPVLPINEIVGTYQDSETIQAIMKGEDEDEEGRVIKEEEFLFTYVITAVDDNKIIIEFGGVKLGEGIYDPVSCSCDFVVAPEFYESMHATSTGDKTMRLVFSKVDGIIQFEQTVVGSEGEPTIAYKV